MAQSTARFSSSPQEMQRVLRLALISRILVLGLIIICRCIASPYDTSASLDPPCLSESNMLDPSARKQEQTGFAQKLGKAIEATVVWDSVYYVRIAQCGYEYEQTYAFLPLLPLAMLVLSKTVLGPLIPVLGQRAVLALSGYILNNIAYVFAGLFLYKLTLLVLKDPKMAIRAVALFCFNPASIFYSSIYSESLFSLLSFAGIYCLLSGMNWKATLLFAMSSAVRSNGVINAGFILFQAMHQTYEAFFRQKRVLANEFLPLETLARFTSVKRKRSLLIAMSSAVRSNGVINAGFILFQAMHQAYEAFFWQKWVLVLFVALLRSVCVFAPFIFFQLYGFLNICRSKSSSQGSRPWCMANVPYLYGFVQSHYWEVGFLRYFQLKQIPNFLLASPMLLLGACSVIEYAVKNARSLFSLGFKASHAERETASVFYFVQREKKLNEITMGPEELPNPPFALPSESENVRIRKGANMDKRTNIQAVASIEHSNDNVSSSQMKEGLFSCLTVPFILQLAFMIFIACFVMHVQVATRFLSVSPPIYWFASYFMESFPIGFKLGYVVWTVFLSYLFLGCLLFSNFYPFT